MFLERTGELVFTAFAGSHEIQEFMVFRGLGRFQSRRAEGADRAGRQAGAAVGIVGVVCIFKVFEEQPKGQCG